MSKSILVIGATGKQGLAVVKQLLEDGWNVRAFTRDKDNEKLTSIDNDKLEIFEGNLGDPESIARAMENQYGVYSVQPIIRDNVEEELHQGKMIIEEAEDAGIHFVVYSTAGGVNRDRTGPHFEALAKIEDTLKASRLNYAIIKPSFFMDNFLRIVKEQGGRLVIPEFINPTIKFAMISSIDIARIAAEIFAHPKKNNHEETEIASDELMLNEIVAEFVEATGKPATIEGDFVSGTAERSWLEDYGYVVDFDQMDDINPQRLKLRDWIRLQNF
ncbi:NmrA/HSCARG family protein [Staphylococcus carnosus]|uniref:NmrA/HSCARG family protein n=1 Tax=Staphylococcus carnosus TaxID=1281 RepID=UPI0020A36E66|nr:NmrA/HSCARG family protein [Staphylococcus carnosus]UTB79690.1 NmrA family protein [Staphylococcus carnosus]